MSTHPNAILLLVLTPDGLARKTYRDILDENGGKTDEVKLGSSRYHTQVMESEYDEGYQISAKEGDIIVFDMVTYGYGERITWTALETQKNALEAWAKAACEKHHCLYKIFVTANYW